MQRREKKREEKKENYNFKKSSHIEQEQELAKGVKEHTSVNFNMEAI